MARASKKFPKIEAAVIPDSQLELVPSSHHNPFWSSDLFNEVYLQNDVPQKRKDLWELDEAGPFYNFCNGFRNLCADLEGADLNSWSERNTINRFIKQVLELLGYEKTGSQEPWAEDEPFTVEEAGENRVYKPDFIIVNDPKELKYIERKKGKEKIDEARSSVIVPIEAKYWGRIEDADAAEQSKRADKKDQIDATKSLSFDEQALKYMEILGKDFGILTDGKTWRLYHSELSTGSNPRCYQFNLGHLMKHVNAGLDRDSRDYDQFIDAAKYFFHFFGKSSLAGTKGERFVDDLLEYSRKYVSRVEEDLKDRFVSAMAHACNGFQRASDKSKTSASLTMIRNVSESHLFNILFIKYCESKGVLPLRQAPEYRMNSLSNVVDKLEYFDPEKDEDNLNYPMLKRMFAKDFAYDPSNTDLYDRLIKLTKMIQTGTSKEYATFEIKGFKESIFSNEEWNFAQENKLTNSEMVRILFELGYCESEHAGRKYQQIPYNFFSPRQLGSIYESFLEFRLDKATEDMVFTKKQWQAANLHAPKFKNKNIPKVKKGRLFFTPDNADRKATGSFYTPDPIVQKVVLDSLGPLVKGKSSKEILQVSIVDPAMGSGHFLGAGLSFLARTYMAALDDERGEDNSISLLEAKRIVLHHCIHGVDINPRAVKLAKMSLWLESASVGASLEDLSDQLLAGDSLLSFDWKKEFPKVFKVGGFSGVLGNPPWLMAAYYKNNDLERLRERYKSADGKFDLYYLFTELSFGLVAPGGRIGFVVPNKFLHTKSASKLREFISEKKSKIHLLDFKEAQVFEGATNYTCCVLVEPNEIAESLRYSHILDSLEIAETFEIDWGVMGGSPWNCNNPVASKIFSKMSAFGTTLESAIERFGTGVQSGSDKLLVVKSDELKNFDRKLFVEMIRGRDVRRYHLGTERKHLFFPYKGKGDGYTVMEENELKQSPKTYSFLAENRSALEKRIWFGKNAKQLSGKWYGLMYLDEKQYFDAPHILSPCLSNWSNFMIGDGNVFATGTAGVVSLVPKLKIAESLYFILGVLNSSLFGFYITKHSPVFSGGYYKFSSPYLKKVPFKRIDRKNKSDLTAHDKIENLVKERLKAKSDDKARQLDAKIDELVFDLYGLTSAERKTVLASKPDRKAKDFSIDAEEAA